MRSLLWFVSIFVLIVSSSALAQHQFVYTNDNASLQTTGAPNTVSAFRANSDGSLTLLSGSPFATGGNGSNGGSVAANDIAVVPRPMSTATSSSLLYAVNQGDGTISAFTITSGTGNLTLFPGSPFLIDGLSGDFSITPNPAGTLLFVTNDSTTVIHVYAISPTGTLSQIPGSPFETGNRLARPQGHGEWTIPGCR